MYFELPKETINNSKVLREYVNKISKANIETKEETKLCLAEALRAETNDNTDTWINKLLKEIAPFLAENTEKIKRIFNTLGILINKTHIKPTRPAHENNTIRQYIKVSLPDIDIELVYNIITDKGVIDVLNKEGIFIHDIDFTQDFHGVINKEMVIMSEWKETKPNKVWRRIQYYRTTALLERTVLHLLPNLFSVLFDTSFTTNLSNLSSPLLFEVRLETISPIGSIIQNKY